MAGEHVVTCAVRRGRKGDWQLIVHTPNSRSSRSIPDEFVAWLNGPHSSHSASGIGRETKVMEAGEPLDLVRLRADVYQGNTSQSPPPDEPANGLHVWLESEIPPTPP